MASVQKSVNVTFYIVRHGECSANVEQKALEPFSDVLTDVGKAQAELLGKHLNQVCFTRAYASDYPRAKETAEIIIQQSETSAIKDVQPDTRLRERDYTGVLGAPAMDCIKILMDKMREGMHYLEVDIPDSETVKQFEDKIIDFLSQIIKELKNSPHDEENILLVSHGLTIQRLMVLLNRRAKDFGIENYTRNLFSERLMRNTSYHKLAADVPRDGTHVAAHIAHAHFREHLFTENEMKHSSDKIRDLKNYTFVEDSEEELKTFEDQTMHYCKPV